MFVMQAAAWIAVAAVGNEGWQVSCGRGVSRKMKSIQMPLHMRCCGLGKLQSTKSCLFLLVGEWCRPYVDC